MAPRFQDDVRPGPARGESFKLNAKERPRLKSSKELLGGVTPVLKFRWLNRVFVKSISFERESFSRTIFLNADDSLEITPKISG